MTKERRLQDAYYKGRCMLIDLGIDYGEIVNVKINSRAKRRWGRCCYDIYSPKWEDCRFVIEISDRLLNDEVSEDALMNTMVHELLHTCKDCMNHGKIWKKLAAMVNSKYGLNIKTCTSAAEKNIKDDYVAPDKKYVLRCPACGHIWKRARMTNAVKYPELYGCSCGYWGLERIA